MDGNVPLRELLEQRLSTLQAYMEQVTAEHQREHAVMRDMYTQHNAMILDQQRVALRAHEEQHAIVSAARHEADILHEERHKAMNEVREQITKEQNTYLTKVEFHAIHMSLEKTVEAMRTDIDLLKLHAGKAANTVAVTMAIFGIITTLILVVVGVSKFWK
jgi:vacuolar-type H+-ATPase subunit H